jgi:hypothetical protein
MLQPSRGSAEIHRSTRCPETVSLILSELPVVRPHFPVTRLTTLVQFSLNVVFLYDIVLPRTLPAECNHFSGKVATVLSYLNNTLLKRMVDRR